jgi:hypothetical protein
MTYRLKLSKPNSPFCSCFGLKSINETFNKFLFSFLIQPYLLCLVIVLFLDRIGNRHWFGSPGSGFVLGKRIRIQKQENLPKLTTKPHFPAFKNGFTVVSTEVLYSDIPVTVPIFFRSKSNFLWWQSVTRIWIWICINTHWFGSRVRIRICIRFKVKKLDPDPLWNQCGSETLAFQKAVISLLILDFYDFWIPFYVRSGSKSGTGMYFDSSSAKARTVVAVPVAQHWFLFQYRYLLAQAVTPFRRPCTLFS